MLSLVVNRWDLRYLGMILLCLCSAANAAMETGERADLKDLLQTEWYWLFRVNETFDKASLPHLTHAHKLKDGDSIGFGLYTIPYEVAKKGLTTQNLIRAPWSSTHSRFFDWGDDTQEILPRVPDNYWKRSRNAVFPPDTTSADQLASIKNHKERLKKISWNLVSKELLDQITTQIQQGEQGFKKYLPIEQNDPNKLRNIIKLFVEASEDTPDIPKNEDSNSEQASDYSQLPLRCGDGHCEYGTFFSSKDRDIHVLAAEHGSFYMLLPHAMVLDFIPGHGEEGTSLQSNPEQWGIKNDPAISETLYPASTYFPSSERLRVPSCWLTLLSSSSPSPPPSSHAKRRKIRVVEAPETAGTPSPSSSLSPTPSLSPPPEKRSKGSVTEDKTETTVLNAGEPSLSSPPAKRRKISVTEEEHETTIHNTGAISSCSKKD